MKTYVSNIDPANDALYFIDKRLASDNYRGHISSQHNRYTFEELVQFLTLLDEYAPRQSLLHIRTTDTVKRPENTPEEVQYAKFCHAAKKQVGKGTQDAMRKNFFVDWHRMGLIERYTAKEEKIKPYQHSRTQYVALSDLGKQFIQNKALEQRFLFSKALNILLDNFISHTLDVLDELKHIDFDEFLFFVSAIDTPQEYGFSLTTAQCVDLVGKYRKLTRKQKEAVLTKLRDELIPEKFDGNKSNQRDFHNWQNKIKQIWFLFDEVVFFTIERDSKIPRLKPIEKTDSRNGKTKMVRSVRPKADYLKEHQVQKTKGFELDHIIPLMDANTIDEFHYLDNWRNLLYLSGTPHAIKTQTGSEYKVLCVDSDNLDVLKLARPSNEEDILLIRNQKEALFNTKHIDTMLKYNADFLDK